MYTQVLNLHIIRGFRLGNINKLLYMRKPTILRRSRNAVFPIRNESA